MECFTKELSCIKDLKNLKASVLEYIPLGVVLIDRDGTIKYVNPAIGTILGSTSTVGLNILEFDTIKKSRINEMIIRGLNGISMEIHSEKYTSFTTNVNKVLNVYSHSIFSDKQSHPEGVILLLQDVTEEYNLKVKMQSTYVSTIAALAETVDARDEYTGEHSKNVYRFVQLICSNLDISESEKEKIQTAASMHDIGKIGVRDNILNKPGKLTEEEYEIMKNHPSIGADIIGKIEGFEDVALIIKHHHERWDGKGYPDGLAGDQIPLGAQLIAIADTYDAIISNRVYRFSLGKDRALQILLEERGKQFNEELVNVFIREIVSYQINSEKAM
jgi:putative nucleotidyltransferase with HDIG domain/PAS domain S-box-containing protein